MSALEQITLRTIRQLSVHANTDTTELLGSFEQEAEGGRFRWVDSELVRALRQGEWLVVDNVNSCSPAVLDRLNGLLEPNVRLRFAVSVSEIFSSRNSCGFNHKLFFSQI